MSSNTIDNIMHALIGWDSVLYQWENRAKVDDIIDPK